MKVIAENRDIIYSNACGCSNASGKPLDSSKQRELFQKWANTNKGLNLRTDGVKDDASSKAYSKYGKEFETSIIKKTVDVVADSVKTDSKNAILDTIASVIKTDETNPPVSATKTPEQEKADKKKKMIKIALIAGGAIALTTIIILIARKKK